MIPFVIFGGLNVRKAQDALKSKSITGLEYGAKKIIKPDDYKRVW